MKKVFALAATLAVAGTASAQCPGGVCPLPGKAVRYVASVPVRYTVTTPVNIAWVPPPPAAPATTVVVAPAVPLPMTPKYTTAVRVTPEVRGPKPVLTFLSSKPIRTALSRAFGFFCP